MSDLRDVLYKTFIYDDRYLFFLEGLKFTLIIAFFSVLLGLFLGAWGVHNFYLGNTSRGVIQIVVTILTCGFGGLWGFIEGIMILAGSINTDANGVPLQD